MTFHPGRARKAEKNAHSSDPSIDRQYWAYVAADQLTDALDEIERLRLLATFPKSESGLITGLCMAIRKTEEQAAEIERLRAKVGKMEFLMRSTDDTCLVCAIKLEVIDQQAAHIQKLEDALMEERANKMIQTDDCTQNPDAAEFHHRCICEYNVKKCPVGQWWLDRARQALRAEGKIGPDADECPDDLPPIGSPYRSWQITDERKAAILHCKRMLTFLKEDDAPCYDVEKITKDESVLVAMLKEVERE